MLPAVSVFCQNVQYGEGAHSYKVACAHLKANFPREHLMHVLRPKNSGGDWGGLFEKECCKVCHRDSKIY